MKKLFLLCLIVAAAAFVSCSEKDGDGTGNDASIVGRWSIYQEIWEHNGQTIVKDYPEDEIRQIYEFNADGTGKDIYSEYERGEWYEDVINFTYTLHENKIYYYIVDEEDEEYGSHAYSFTIEKLTANEMVFIYKDDYDEMQISRYFLRRI